MAKDYLSTRSGLVAIDRDQNIVSASDLSRTKQDVSQWVTKGGLLYNKGWAVCDGSTYDPLVFPELDDALGNPVSKVVPNGPYKTNHLTENDVTITASSGFTVSFAYIYAYSDSSGNWRMGGNIRLSAGSDQSGTTITIDGILFPDTSAASQKIDVGATTQSGTSSDQFVSLARATENTNTFLISSSNSVNRYRVSFDVTLASKPTWADANLEDNPIIATANNVLSNSLGLPEATADGAGLLTLDQNAESNRNLIINGAFEINQRGPDSAGNSNRYTADRWKINASGATTLSTIIDDGTNDEFSKYIRLEATTADDNWGWFHLIESVKTLAGKKGTLSFYARSNDSSVANLDIEAAQIFGTGGSPSPNNNLPATNIALTNQWVKHEITIDFDGIGSKTLGTDNNDYLSIGFILGQGLNQTGQFDLKLVKLEEGSKASKFTRAGGTYAGELALCHRYFFKYSDTNTVPIGIVHFQTTGTYRISFPCPVEMRNLPDISTNGTGTQLIGTIRGASSTENVLANSLPAIVGFSSNYIYTSKSGVGTLGQGTNFVLNGGWDLYFDSEL